MTNLREELSRLPVFDAEGRTLALGELLGPAPAPVVLVFVRHFACPSCSSTAHAFAARAVEIAALGASLIVVGSGSPPALSSFAERVGFPPSCVVVTEPTLRAHALAGMLRSKWATFQPPAHRSLPERSRWPGDGDLRSCKKAFRATFRHGPSDVVAA
jgi:peroxiredoxin